jgi:hypothetical protein
MPSKAPPIVSADERNRTIALAASKLQQTRAGSDDKQVGEVFLLGSICQFCIAGMPIPALGFLILTAVLALLWSHYQLLWSDEFGVITTLKHSQHRQAYPNRIDETLFV